MFGSMFKFGHIIDETFVQNFEQEFSCQILMICLAGSLCYNNTTDNSDIDLFFLLDRPINNDYNLKYKEIDIWWNTLYEILTVYQGFLAQTPLGITNFQKNNIIYCKSEEIYNYCTSHEKELIEESLYPMFELLNENLYPNIMMISPDMYFSKKRYKGNMQNMYYGSIILNNYKEFNTISNILELTSSQKQQLRDIRGKDNIQLSFNESLDLINSVYTKELIEFFKKRKNSNNEHLLELYKIIIEEINMVENNLVLINRCKMFLSLEQDLQVDESLQFYATATSEEKIDFLNTIFSFLAKKYPITSEIFWEKFISLLPIIDIADLTENYLFSLRQIIVDSKNKTVLNEENLVSLIQQTLNFSDDAIKNSFGLFILQLILQTQSFNNYEIISALIKTVENNTNIRRLILII